MESILVISNKKFFYEPRILFSNGATHVALLGTVSDKCKVNGFFGHAHVIDSEKIGTPYKFFCSVGITYVLCIGA